MIILCSLSPESVKMARTVIMAFFPLICQPSFNCHQTANTVKCDEAYYKKLFLVIPVKPFTNHF